jgi:hypothetical protein
MFAIAIEDTKSRFVLAGFDALGESIFYDWNADHGSILVFKDKDLAEIAMDKLDAEGLNDIYEINTIEIENVVNWLNWS